MPAAVLMSFPTAARGGDRLGQEPPVAPPWVCRGGGPYAPRDLPGFCRTRLRRLAKLSGLPPGLRPASPAPRQPRPAPAPAPPRPWLARWLASAAPRPRRLLAGSAGERSSCWKEAASCL